METFARSLLFHTNFLYIRLATKYIHSPKGEYTAQMMKPTTKNYENVAFADQPFLESIAKYLLATYKKDIHKLHVVLPTRRACLHLKYYLSAFAETTLIAPVIRSMEDFVAEVSSLEIADHLYLLFELYHTYKQFDKAENHNLEQFAPLGTVILRDFDMIDRNLADGKKLFEYLADVKRIETWAEGLGESDELRKSLDHYFEFWKYLKDTYLAFNKKLKQDGKAYSGLSFRWLAENATQLIESKQFEKVIFVGFNQLTIAEETFIRSLLHKGKAEIHWDMDKQYVADNLHEAGRYFRTYLKHETEKLTDEVFEPYVIKGIAENPKKIEIIGVNSRVLQTKVVGDLLDKMMQNIGNAGKQEAFKQSINHTAVLVSEESLLIPLLYSLPIGTETELQTGISLKEHLNITMGLGIEKTPLFTLLKNFFRLQDNIKTDNNGKIAVYYKDLLRILRHPFIFYSAYKEPLQEFLRTVQKENKIFIAFEDLYETVEQTKVCSENDKSNGLKSVVQENNGLKSVVQEENRLKSILQVLFRNWDKKVPNAIAQFFDVILLLDTILDKEKNLLEGEYLLKLYQILKRSHTVFGQQADLMTVNTFKQLFFETIKNTSVPFSGEPLAPVHLMGMLETHTLDFENVIILSCNEGVLPKGKLVNSIIPFDIRAMFGLPTHKETDASAAYTFYRLFHRAKNITLIYAEGGSDDGMQMKEKSRFITQVQNEWKNLKNIEITERQITLPLPVRLENAQQIPKTPDIIAKIRKYLEGKIEDENNNPTKGGITPSYINTYLQNPLDFFKKKVLNLKDPDEMQEWLEANTFGNLIHGYLEQLIEKNQLLGKSLTETDLQRMLKEDGELLQILDKILLQTAGKVVATRGKNMILKRVAQYLLKKFIAMQATQQSLNQIIAVERELKAIIPVEVNGEILQVKLKGNADRIDIQDQAVRVVDYKTGAFDGHKPSAKCKQDLLEQEKYDSKTKISNKGRDKIVQLMIYRYLLLKEVNEGTLKLPPPFDTLPLQYENVKSGFYFFQKLTSDFVEYELKDETNKNDTQTAQTEAFMFYVEDFIATVVRDMLDKSKDFTDETGLEAETEE